MKAYRVIASGERIPASSAGGPLLYHCYATSGHEACAKMRLHIGEGADDLDYTAIPFDADPQLMTQREIAKMADGWDCALWVTGLVILTLALILGLVLFT